MIRKQIAIQILLLVSTIMCANPHDKSDGLPELTKYHRSSLYSLVLKHPELEFGKEIVDVFKSVPLPDRFNNHDLKFKALPAPVMRKVSKHEIDNAYQYSVMQMLERNKIGGRLVGKWFNRDKDTGTFDMALVSERGQYDASIMDVKKALASVRGAAMLSDAGEELIGKTYVLVNDIRYGDKSTLKLFVGAGLLAANIAGAASGHDVTQSLASAAELTEKIRGFKVVVTSFLYRLEWDEEAQANFYGTLWIDRGKTDTERMNLWNEAMGNFRLTYVGSATVATGKTALGGVESDRDMFLKVCTRAVDLSIAQLQKNFDEFKVFTPIISTEPIAAYIGMKEGITSDSRFEVLEQVEGDDGRTHYNKVGVVKPVRGKIWDNRFMAAEDHEDGSDLTYTTFEKVSGGTLYPGMLIREIK